MKIERGNCTVESLIGAVLGYWGETVNLRYLTF